MTALEELLKRAYRETQGDRFGVSGFAAMLGVGVGEAVDILHAGERQGWVEAVDGYYQLTDEGVAACAV